MYKKIFIVLFTVGSLISQAQQEFTLNTAAANVTASMALINLPVLNGNPNAIIIATAQGNTATLNTHPIGAWYYSGKWYLFNSDFSPMLVGLTYKVQYFLSPGNNQFLHLVTQQNLGAEGSYIDNPALNNKPNAQFSILPNHSPTVRSGSWLNPNEAKKGYSTSTGKWYITNANGQPLLKGCAYNIVVNNGSVALPSDPGNTGGIGNCSCPASLPPTGVSGGDLGGTYPNPSVQKIMGNPVSAASPAIGQVLKWNGNAWIPADDNVNTGNNPTPAITGKPAFLYYTQTAEAEVNGYNKTATIAGLDNKFFTLPQSSKIIIHINAWLVNTNTSVLASGSVGNIRVEILSNTSNAVVAFASSYSNLFPAVGESVNATGFGLLPAGTYYTRVTIGRNNPTDAGLRSGMSDKLLIEIFPD